MEKIPENIEPPIENPQADEGHERYAVMSPEDIASYKKWAKEKIKEWHDILKPDCIFLTETSGIEFGYLIKSAYEHAYPSEDLPRFYRIDVKAKDFGNFYFRPRIENITPENRKKLEDFIDERIPNKEARVLIFDEAGRGRTPERVRGVLERIGGINPNNIIIDHGMPETYRRTANSLEGYENMGAGEYIKPTVRNDRKPYSHGYSEATISKNFKAGIVHVPDLRKRALDYIHDLKLVGKEAGEEFLKELAS